MKEKNKAPRFTSKLGVNKHHTVEFNIIHGSFICCKLAVPASMRHPNAKVQRKNIFQFVKMNTYRITQVPCGKVNV